jgi:hypothetical protein
VVQDGWTPLHWAAYKEHTVTVKALLAAGADVNIQDKVCTSLPPAYRSPSPLTLSPCLPRVWVCAMTGRGTVTEEAVRW